MSKPRLTKPQKTLAAVIESEGARILSFTAGGSMLKCDYTFDDINVFTQHLPPAAKLDRRWLLNFRSNVRKSKPR